MKESEDIKIQKKMTNLLKRLPSESVAALAKTDDQLAYLTHCRTFNTVVADCWLKRMGFDNDPLAPLLESKQISEATQDSVYYSVRFFQSLWGVVQIGWRFIKEEIGSQFKSASNFFEAILRVWHDNNFAVCLEPFWKFTVSDLNKSAKVITAYSQGTISSTKDTQPNIYQLRSLAAPSLQFKNHWLMLALSICYASKKKSLTLQSEIRSFERTILEFSDLAERWSARKRPSKEFSRLTSFEFQNGYQTKGNLSSNVTISLR